MALPNLIIAGLGRSGTTSMFQHLVEHPDVCGSKKKETSYFVPAIYGRPVAPIETYRALFDHHDGERVIAEATPGYFIGGRTVAELIDRTLGPEVKVVLSLRDPATRLVSFYNLCISRLLLDPTMTLEQYVDMCEHSSSVRETRDESSEKYQGYYGGFYADVLADWFDVFGDRLRVVFFERLEVDTQGFMTDLASWVGIDPGFYAHRSFEVQNASRGYRFAMVHRLANAVSDRAEFALRRHPKLKNVLRKGYLRLNSSAPSTGGPAGLRHRLEATFADSNARTRTLLESHGYTELPPWLSSGMHANDGGSSAERR